MFVNDITITELNTITGFDITTGNFLFALDELQSASIAQGEEKVDITGKQGRKLNSLKRNKTVTISGANGLVSGGMLELQVGGSFENKQTVVRWADYLTVSSNTATTTYKAIGTAGAEITDLYIKNSNGTLGARLEQDSAAAAGKFAYDPSTKALSFSGIADNTEIAVFYDRKIQADVLVNESDHYSKKCALYVDCIGEDKCANLYRVQIYVPKADFNGEFTLDLGDDQTVHNFEAEALSGACGAGGMLWTYTVFGANEPDAPALSSIAVTTPPTTTSYSAGQAFNSTGMVVTATYADATTKVVTGYTFAPSGILSVSNTAITITYSEGGITKTTTQAITVSE